MKTTRELEKEITKLFKQIESKDKDSKAYIFASILNNFIEEEIIRDFQKALEITGNNDKYEIVKKF